MKMKMISRFPFLRTWLPVIFFILLLIVGFLAYQSYGISWDEPIQHNLGLATWKYLSGESDLFFRVGNQYHNPVIELMEVLPEKLFNLKTGSEIYHSRHLLNFLLFWTGTIFFYLLA